MIFSTKTDIKNEDSNSKKYDRFAINKDIKSLFSIIKTLVAKLSNSKIIKCLIILLLNLNFIILFLKGSTKWNNPKKAKILENNVKNKQTTLSNL